MSRITKCKTTCLELSILQKRNTRTMKKLNILSVSHYYVTENRGGGEVMLHEMLKALAEKGHNVDAVVTESVGKKVKLDGVNVYKGKEHLSRISKKYHVIISHFQNADETFKKAKILGIPTVFIVHNTFDNTHSTLRLNPNLTVFNTEWVRKYHKHRGRSIVVHPPVYTENHETTRGEKITLVNLIPSKGSNMFYHMAQQLPQLRFLGVKGGYYKDKQEVYTRFRNVEFQENTDNMKKDVWSKTRILLMPSSYESYGMAAVEALASGIPVIANDTPGLRESLSYAGIFPENTQIQTWKNAIIRLSNPDEYEKASQLALKRAAEINPRAELNVFVDEVERLVK